MGINMDVKTVLTPQELAAFSELDQKCTQANLVLPKGLTHNALCIVGESLGSEENLNGEYFIGKAGKLLDKLLKEAGIIRSASHITNVIKVQPPGNKVERLHEIGLSIQDFIPYLKEELDTIKPKAILAVGRHALEALTSEHGITKWRGSVLECSLTENPVSVLPTLHPSYLQRGMMHLYPYVRHDMQNFARLGFGIYKPEDPYEQIINPSLTQCLDFLSDIANTATETCFDIETVAHQRITCIGWTNGPHKAICIPFRHNGLKLRWAEHEQIMLLDAMKQIYQKPRLLKIGQNIHYDIHFLLPLLGFPREPIFDTRYAHTLLHADAKHDLGFLTSVYTNMNYHKDEAKDWASKKVPKDETLWGYNIKDVITTHRVAQAITKDLKEANQYDFFTGFMMPFRRVIFDMEAHGINVDMDLMKELRDYIQEDELPIALDIIHKMTGREMNPNSSKQVGEYLAEELHLPIPRTAKGNYTVKEEILEALVARHPKHRQLLKQILCARVLKAKDLGTYLTAVVSKDNHMKCSYGMTITGRLTSSTNQIDEGTNLQNIPKHLRQIFIPEPDQVFVDADLSQAEARVMAWLMKSDKLKEVFHSGHKIHKIVGGWIYDKDPEDLTPTEYLIAKKTVHGCVDEKTQVLTLTGWKYINEPFLGQIAQWDPKTKEITFVYPHNLEPIPYKGIMYRHTQGYFDQMVTPTHRMPHWQVRYGRKRKHVDGPVRDIEAQKFTNRRNSYKLPLAGVYSSSTPKLNPNEMSLLVAIQADCSVRRSGEVEANFTKGYKIARLKYLLKQLRIDYTEYPYKDTGSSFYIPKQWKVVALLNCFEKHKTFSFDAILNNTPKVLDTFIRELGFWDGRVNKEQDGTINSWQYYTTNAQNAEVAATIAHLTNKRAVVSMRENWWEEKRTKDLYTVSISCYPLGDLTEMKTEIIKDFGGVVYCPTVMSSYFLIRRNGHISITGNSNYQMGERKFATIIERPVADAREIMRKYSKIVPELPQYHKDIQREIETTRKLVTMYGRTRIFTGRLDDSTFKSGYAQLPQSTVVDTINLGILGLWCITPRSVHFITQTHDSILLSIDPNKVEYWNKYIKAHLETLRELEINGDSLVIPLDIEPPKDNWYGA